MYYKCLRKNRLSPYRAFQYPLIGMWTPRVSGSLEKCKHGYHVCLEEDILRWSVNEAYYIYEVSIHEESKQEWGDKIGTRQIRLDKFVYNLNRVEIIIDFIFWKYANQLPYYFNLPLDKLRASVVSNFGEALPDLGRTLFTSRESLLLSAVHGIREFAQYPINPKIALTQALYFLETFKDREFLSACCRVSDES